jgi:squalene-hopene/tetraprenyl-beta-curcumene cyclase
MRIGEEDAIRRGIDWLVGMQSSGGGWGAFDVDNSAMWLYKIPFCDFGKVTDEPSADVTAHAIELLGTLGVHDETTQRGVDWLLAEQEDDGSWFGRWGVNHLYGVGAVLPALRAAGEPMDSLMVRRAVRWLGERQNPDGGWGETCASYVDVQARGRGESAPSQTAWALLGLIAAGRADSAAAERGVRFLVDRQRPDGAWDEEAFTGCGFPGYGIGEEHGARISEGRELSAGFMIRYHLYRNCFPLLALGRYRAALRTPGLAMDGKR